MSGIYGYIDIKNSKHHDYGKILSSWNAFYGKERIVTEELPGGELGVWLEHFSTSVPCQKSPLSNEECVAVIDALIYNRDELLEGVDEEWNKLSDEELIFQLICRGGIKSLAGINGDFAGVIYHRNDGRITMFRDHLGLRPIYYYNEGGLIIFSTEMRGVLAIPAVDASLDEAHFYGKMMASYTNDSEGTDFAEVHYVKQGSYCEFIPSSEGYIVSPAKEYWRLGSKKIRLKTDQDYRMEMKRLVEDSIRRRIMAVDGKVGSELSGGLDSSIISILVNRIGGKAVYHSWSPDPKDLPIIKNNDERNIIQAICKQEDIECKFLGSDNPIPNTYRYMMDNAFPPFAYTLPISQVSAWMETQGVRAVFTGHGGDEGVSHRGKIYELWHQKEYLPCLKILYSLTKGQSLRPVRTLKRLRNLLRDYREYYEVAQERDSMENFLNVDFRKRQAERFVPLHRAYYCDPVEHIDQGRLRVRMDNTVFQAAPFGVRYVYPYLDYRVMDYAVSVPRRLYHNGRKNRLLYLETFEELMPEALEVLHSKESPSTVFTGEVPKQVINNLNESAEIHLAKLDREYWSRYLDFDKLDNFRLKENSSREECTDFRFKLDHIMYCVMVQNMLDKIKDGQLAKEYPRMDRLEN